LEGREQAATIAAGAYELYNQGYWELGILVFCLSIAFPLFCIGTGLYVVLPLRFGRMPRHVVPAFRAFEACSPWAMTEVFLLGLIVAYVKLSGLATLIVGDALYAFVALTITTAWVSAALDPRVVWSRIPYSTPRPRRWSGRAIFATSPGPYVACHHCQLVVDAHDTDGVSKHCPRCGASLHKRKPDSISRTWALVIAATICYVPANLLPIMTVVSFGQGEPDTILSGVQALIEYGMYPVALLVFFASICVPVLKIVVLCFLLISVQVRSGWRTRDRSVMYRITEAVGRWSMIDIFMISILAALVKLDAIATIEPGPAAVFFAGVVILTMFAAMSFDPRLIWDAARKDA
jgi:paraquat-inducible protein A